MNKELKGRWLAALRSGEYRQGAGRLKRMVSEKQALYCCLGVLAETSEPESLVRKGICFLFNGGESYLRLPDGEWAFLPKETQKSLALMNDRGESFHAIADWIGNNVPEDTP